MRTTGKLGQALDFDGKDDYVDMGNSISLQLTGAMSVSAWVYAKSDVTQRFVSKKGANGNRSWDLYMDATGNGGMIFGVSRDGTDAGGVDQVNLDPPLLNQWVHLVGVYEPSVAVRLYANGALVGSDTSVAASQFNSSLNARIGSRADGTGFMNGLIDDVRIYNRVLSQDEIKRLYNIGMGR